MADVLACGGGFLGLFWAHGRPGGPPFTTSREELEQRFGRRFAIDAIEVPPDSVATRLGQELLFTLRRRPGAKRA